MIVLFICLYAISQVSAEDVNDDNLTSEKVVIEDVSDNTLQVRDYDTLSGEGDVYKSFDEIQNLIDNSHDGDVIPVSGKYKGTGTEITVDKSVTIQGESSNTTFISGEYQSRIFHITAPDVVIKNIYFLRGETSYNGGAIYSEDYLTHVYDSIFNNCSANNGGATYNCRAEGCVFLFNSAESYGGAMYGGCVVKSAFGNNTAEYGGAIYYPYTDYSVTDSYFENNSADYGGAIYFDDEYCTVSGTGFENNHANYDRRGLQNCII